MSIISWKKIAAALTAITFPAAAVNAAPPADEIRLAGSDAVHSYILLDRTGSMSSIWDEALGSVNAYAQSVGEPDEGEADDLKTEVTLAVFDFQEGFQFDVLRDGVDADGWSPVTNDEASPRGMTPLFDAIGRMISTAEADNPEKAVIVIMTDGLENSSRELTKDGANAALDRAKKRGWEVVFLGAEFANFADAEAVGVAGSKSMAIGAGRMQDALESTARKTRAYGKGEEAEITYDEADRAEAGEEDVKQRTGQ